MNLRELSPTALTRLYILDRRLVKENIDPAALTESSMDRKSLKPLQTTQVPGHP